MEQASAQLDYESAAHYRDRIAALKHVQERQYVVGESGDADVLGVSVAKSQACIEVMFIRNGANLGSRSFFPTQGAETDPAEILSAFMPQYYLGKPIPQRLYTSCAIEDRALLETAFSEQTNTKIAIMTPRQGAPKRWVEMAKRNADEALRRRLADRQSLAERFDALRQAFGLEATPERVECFDVSHTFGEATVTSCVVFDSGGPVKSDYRRFNIEGVTAGDDYAALAQALERRYRKVKEGGGKLPDLLLIDGGKGQVAAAEKILAELQIVGLRLIGVAKGPTRKPGLEQLFLSGSGEPTILPADSPALHLIQQIRDEAHRFAITGHRLRRGKARTVSSLERIPGVGDKRRQALLKHLGGMQEVRRAGVEDLARVPGISPELARKIYDVFHEQDV
jgi:excinuclease ABC subunit C